MTINLELNFCYNSDAIVFSSKMDSSQQNKRPLRGDFQFELLYKTTHLSNSWGRGNPFETFKSLYNEVSAKMINIPMYEGVNQSRQINNSLMARVFKRKPQRDYLIIIGKVCKVWHALSDADLRQKMMRGSKISGSHM